MLYILINHIYFEILDYWGLGQGLRLGSLLQLPLKLQYLGDNVID